MRPLDEVLRRLDIYFMTLVKGSYVRWVSSHHIYEASGDVLVGLEPIYRYGIILEVSKKKPAYFIVASCDDGRLHILDVHEDDVEILSEAKNG